MKITALTLGLALAMHSSTVMAQADAADDAAGRVEVSHLRDPELRSYTQMVKGLRAYRDQRRMAPDSALYFILIPKSTRVKLEDVTMRLASDEASMPIAIAADGSFQLPLIEQKQDGEYDLILNKPKGQFLIRPYVKSAHLADDTKRLGDFRLECEVRWAIERQDVSMVFLAYVKLLSSGNPCSARTVAVGFYAPAGVDAVRLDTPKTTLNLKVQPYKTYSLPLWDKDLADDALVRYGRTHGLLQD